MPKQRKRKRKNRVLPLLLALLVLGGAGTLVYFVVLPMLGDSGPQAVPLDELQPAFAQQMDEHWWVISSCGVVIEAASMQPQQTLPLFGRSLNDPQPGQPAQWQGVATMSQDLQQMHDALGASPLRQQVSGLRMSGYRLPDVVLQGRIRVRFGTALHVGGTQDIPLADRLALVEQVLRQLDVQNPNYRGILDLSVQGQMPFTPNWDTNWVP
ncbi:MAG: cell division protein FtsQ/DivIB [Oscillospiraceae bacterium]|nr:cell division protein FtsQ/DivIB [Oscillospiraceae bacterium]